MVSFWSGGKVLVIAFRKYLTSHGHIGDFAIPKGILRVWGPVEWVFFVQVERSLLYLSENITSRGLPTLREGPDSGLWTPETPRKWKSETGSDLLPT